MNQIPHWHKPVVIDLDDPLHSEFERALINQPHVKAIIVTTDTVKEAFRTRGVTRPIHVIPQGVALDTLEASKREQIRAKYKGNEIVVGFVAPRLTLSTDLEYRKVKHGVNDIDFLAAAVEQARKVEPRIRLWLIGNATEAVQRFAAERAWIQWLGYVPIAELLNYIANFDIGAYPRWRKLPDGQFSVKLAQYLGCGVPILSTNVHESFIVSEAQGGIIADSAESFAEGLVWLAQSEQLRKLYGEAGRKYAGEHLNWNEIVPRYQQIILEAQ